MFSNLGWSWQPGVDAVPMSQGGGALGGGRAAFSPQEAIRILSLRIPKRAAMGQIAPQTLLNARGASQFGGAAGLGGVLAMLTQALGRPQGLSPGGGAFSLGGRGVPQWGAQFDPGSSDPAGMVGPSGRLSASAPSITIGQGAPSPTISAPTPDPYMSIPSPHITPGWYGGGPDPSGGTPLDVVSFPFSFTS